MSRKVLYEMEYLDGWFVRIEGYDNGHDDSLTLRFDRSGQSSATLTPAQTAELAGQMLRFAGPHALTVEVAKELAIAADWFRRGLREAQGDVDPLDPANKNAADLLEARSDLSDAAYYLDRIQDRLGAESNDR